MPLYTLDEDNELRQSCSSCLKGIHIAWYGESGSLYCSEDCMNKENDSPAEDEPPARKDNRHKWPEDRT